ncbi:lysine-specific demethylase 3A-B [Sesbania bispinosa]|nr:lysine-specific demethylase 3A-B [Sesbania bispinosa]
MEVVVSRQEQSNQHAEDKLQFSRCSKAFGTSKRKAEEINEYGGNKKPEPEEEEETMECLKKITPVGMEAAVAQRGQSNQHTNNNPDKISNAQKLLKFQKKKVQGIHKHTKPNSEMKQNLLLCSKRTPKLPSRKGEEPKKLTASNKKRKFEDDPMIDNFEEDEETLFLLKAKTRSRASRMDNVMNRAVYNLCRRYPDMLIEEIAQAAHFATSNWDITNYEKAQYLQYMINLLLPYLKQICHEQSQEEEIEAKIQVVAKKYAMEALHPGRYEFQYVNRGYDYMHGGDPLPMSCDLETSDGHIELSTEWNAKNDGSVVVVQRRWGVVVALYWS